MSKFISIIKESAEEVIEELKKFENLHPKINAIFVKGDKNNLISNIDFTELVPPSKYGVSLEIE